VLGGTRWYGRLGALALGPIFARRIAIDWARLARHRRQMGFPLPDWPVVAGVGTVFRLIELAGGLTAAAGPPQR
jgi:hypothetical protein